MIKYLSAAPKRIHDFRESYIKKDTLYIYVPWSSIDVYFNKNGQLLQTSLPFYPPFKYKIKLIDYYLTDRFSQFYREPGKKIRYIWAVLQIKHKNITYTMLNSTRLTTVYSIKEYKEYMLNGFGVKL